MLTKIKLSYYMKVLVLTVVLLFNISIVNATENSKNLNLNFNIVEDKLQTTITNENEGININIKYEQYDEGAYSHIYQSHNEDWESYDTIVLEVENKSNEPKMINLQIETQTGDIFKLREGSIVFFDGADSYRKGKMLYSNLKLPSQYSGRIYFLFDSFINVSNNTTLTSNDLQNISAWGITFTPSSNEKDSIISLKKAELLKKEVLSNLDALKNIKIIGNNEVQVPLVGESIEIYKVDNIENAEFSLLEDYQGVTLSKDGRLLVNDKAAEGDIVFKISIGDEIKYEEVIELKNSWAFNKADEDGVPYGLLNPEESPTVNSGEKFIFLESSITVVKVLLVVSCVLFIVIYTYWKQKRRAQNRMEEI